MTETILTVDRSNAAVAKLTLNRPERRNSLTIELMQAICHEMESLANDPLCRVAILNGAGRAFCSGLDLHEAAEMRLAEEGGRWVAKTLETIANTPLVTIAAAHGAAYAGGAGLMAACDFAVASDDLRVCFPEVRHGLIPALIAAVLSDRLRDAELRELLLLAEPIDAERALSLGLVQRIVSGDRLAAESRRIAESVRKGAPNAIRETKRLLREIRRAGGSDFSQRALEFHMIARKSDEACEGLAAFRERRDPDWTSSQPAGN